MSDLYYISAEKYIDYDENVRNFALGNQRRAPLYKR